MSRNTIARTDARQSTKSILIDFTLADFVDNNEVIDIALPANSVVISGFVAVTDSADTTSTDVLDVGDATVANRYKNDINLKSEALTALVPTGAKVSTLRLTRVPADADAPSMGVRLFVEYAVFGVSCSTED